MHKGFICYSLIAIFSFIFLFASISYADDVAKDPAKEYWDAIAKRPDATITITKNPITGGEIKTAKFKGGVEITSDGEGTVGLDTSGLGAVLCLREVILTLQLFLQECPSSDQFLHAEDVDKVIEKMDNFIVANSISPVTLAEIATQKQEWRKRLYERMNRPIECSNEAKNEMKNFWKAANGKNGDGFEKMLSVPRPPVMNPCF